MKKPINTERVVASGRKEKPWGTPEVFTTKTRSASICRAVRALGSNNREVGAARARAGAKTGQGGCLHT